MAIFGPKPWVTPLEKCQFFNFKTFSTFGTSCFYCLDRRFFNLEYRKSHFPNLQRLKKNVGKMAIFEPKPWVNPFGKTSIFRILELLVFIAQKRVFSIQNIEKVILLTYSARKKNVGKMAIIGPKPWVNPFGKSSIFRHSKVLVFIAKKGVFFVLEYRKSHYPNQYCLKKRVGKMAILGPKPWINPFGKMSFFRILELLVFITQKGVFSIQIIEKVIFLTYTAEKKMSQKWPYLDQNHGLTFLEKC